MSHRNRRRGLQTLEAVPQPNVPPAANNLETIINFFTTLVRLPIDHPKSFFSIAALVVSGGFSYANRNDSTPSCVWVNEGLSASDALYQYQSLPFWTKSADDRWCERLARTTHYEELDNIRRQDNSCEWFVKNTPPEDALKDYRRIPPYKKTAHDKSCETLAKAKADRKIWQQNQDIHPLKQRIKMLEKSTQTEWVRRGIDDLKQEIEQIKNPPPRKKSWFGW